MSLKLKFILAFGSLILLLFLGLGSFWVGMKTQELSRDLSTRAQSFAELTADQILDLNTLYLQKGDFLPFQRELSALLRREESIEALQVMNYAGELLFDSKEETLERYSGEKRSLDASISARVQSPWLSFSLENGRIIFVKLDAQKNRFFVDSNEQAVAAPELTDRLIDFIVPRNSAAVRYFVDYSEMDARLEAARLQIVVAAALGMILTLMLSVMLSVSMTNPLAALKNGALRLAKGDFSTRVEVRSRDEIGVLAQTFNTMAEDLSQAVETRVYSERVTKELEMASKIQEDLLPKGHLELPDLDVAGDLHPATEIGGDAFDFIETDAGEWLVYLGDVSGHGVPAGILSSVANGLIYSMRNELDLKTLAVRLNSVIQKKASNAMFMTMALTRWNPARSELSFLNAGHLPLLHYKAATHTLEELKLPGIALGMIDDIASLVNISQVKLESGDLIVLYSDGFPEAQNEAREQYGMDRLRKMVLQSGHDLLTAEAVKNTIFGDVMQFIGSREHLDDITIVVMRKK